MRCLVLGSSGQVGAHLTQYARSLGHTVVTWDHVLGDEYDLRRRNDGLHDVMRSVDIVFFLAFDVGGSRYLKDRQGSKGYLDNNIWLMSHTFDALEATGVPFVFASSQMSNMLGSAYGMLKRIGEFYTQALNGINVRFWNVYGLESVPEKYHVITDFLIAAAHDHLISMRTTGREQRQFLHADDSSAALLAIAERNESLDRDVYYDVTSFAWHSILDVAQVIASSIYPGTSVVTATAEDETQTLRNEPTGAILDFWQPTITLADGIADIERGMRELGLL